MYKSLLVSSHKILIVRNEDEEGVKNDSIAIVLKVLGYKFIT